MSDKDVRLDWYFHFGCQLYREFSPQWHAMVRGGLMNVLAQDKAILGCAE